MVNLRSAIENTVPITLFNRGQAGKIFEEVRRDGPKVVIKNNAPECILLSPEEYIRLMDEVNDAQLLAIATERMSHFDPDKLLSEEEVYERLGITKEDLADIDVDIE
ncbi:MAG: type II toxin-antitoxin system Phd/YefM family antitoxin [Oscillospiraceae bacterium]|nr:type II toxin-antitoxin system Phd/YefM family antitoxin [Oscillospiraceae bacterium]